MGLDPFPPRCLSLTSLFPISFSLSYLVGGLTLSLTNNNNNEYYGSILDLMDNGPSSSSLSFVFVVRVEGIKIKIKLISY